MVQDPACDWSRNPPRMAPGTFRKRQSDSPAGHHPPQICDRAVGHRFDLLLRDIFLRSNLADMVRIVAAARNKIEFLEHTSAGGDPVCFRLELVRFDQRLRADAIEE